MEETRALVERLFSIEKRVPPALARQLVARRAEAEPLLRAIIDDDALFDEGSRGDGWAPLHALELLGAMKATAALPRMLQLLAEADAETLAYNRAYFAIRDLGALALEPCLAAYTAATDEEVRQSLATVIAELGIRDERIFTLLVDRLATDLELGPSSLAEYGDPRALPHLVRALDAYQFVRADRPFSNEAVIELCASIEELGGQLTDAQLAKRERALAQRRRYRDEVLDDVSDGDEDAPPPGRNDPCWCGSGKKYKKCHLVADADAR